MPRKKNESEIRARIIGFPYNRSLVRNAEVRSAKYEEPGSAQIAIRSVEEFLLLFSPFFRFHLIGRFRQFEAHCREIGERASFCEN